MLIHLFDLDLLSKTGYNKECST